MKHRSPRPVAPRVLALLGLTLPGLPAQERVSLDGTWQVRPAAADAAWLPVQVPAPFETALGIAFDGVADYRHPLPLRAEWRDHRIAVEFAAVATAATVACNGTEVGRHLGGWTPFRVDLTPHLRWDGSDVLEVRVDEKVGHNTQGFLPVIQPHFGGIWQPVTLCIDRGPVLDPTRVFVFGHGDGSLRFAAAADAAGDGAQLRVTVRDGAAAIATRTVPLQDGRADGRLQVPAPRLWSPDAPHLYRVDLELLDARAATDHRLQRRVGFRDLRAEGTRIRWNGAPLQVRGLLHWGYSPPHLAPPADPAFWRRQLEDFRALGFNLVKCCLWVPPRCFYEICDEIGLLVWQEYPTWHPRMDAAHRDELLAEYQEFFAHDRSHPSVAFRSLTCETGQGADLAVIQALYDACKAAVPDTLVVDDSSWIGWQRVTDFWDEHPYGNNSWWRGRLAHFLRHIEQHGSKPLLLGECMAADTWVDLDRWRTTHGDTQPWWQPLCLASQAAEQEWLRGAFGPQVLASLEPIARDYGLRNRKYQIEQLRLVIPDAGYVVSVARDFGKARMGLWDDFDRPKWSERDWAFQRDTMLCLDLPHDRRAQADGLRAPVRVSHYGSRPLRGELHLRADTVPPVELRASLQLQPGELGDPLTLQLPSPTGDRCDRVRIDAVLSGSHPARNHWDLWRIPPEPPAAADVRQVERLDEATLDHLLAGGRVLLQAGDRPGSLRTEGMWFLKGAPFAPPHPLHTQLPAELLLESQGFDLDRGRVLPWRLLRDQVDPILAFWETHDIAEVRWHLLAFDCRVGAGRLLVTCLDHESALGRHVLQRMARHLAHGPAPRRALTEGTIAALRGLLTARSLPLPVWRFRTDPDDVGLAGGWQDPGLDATAAPWRDLRAGSHWENQAEDLRHYTGVAWYRIDVEVPADWAGRAARAVFDGVDDSYVLWCNGAEVGRFGDPATGATVWLERTVAELGTHLRPGARNTLVLRVVDHQGAGGLWRPAFLTTGPADDRSQLLH